MSTGSKRRGAADPTDAAALVSAIERERGLLDELRQGLERQRQAVAENDVEGIEHGVHHVHRVLFTLSEATARRRSLVGMLGGGEDSRLSDIPELLGEAAPPGLADAIGALSDSARVVQEALERTRQILQGAAEAGDRFIKTLVAADTRGDGYPAGDRQAAGALLNHEV